MRGVGRLGFWSLFAGRFVRAVFAPGLTVEAVAQLLDRLLARLARSRLKPSCGPETRSANTPRGILAACRLNLSNARGEAFNNVKLLGRRAYGFRFANAALALLDLACDRSH